MKADTGRAARSIAPWVRRARGRLSEDELEALRWAHGKLEHPSLAARLSDYVGEPIEGLGKLLPDAARHRLAKLAEFSIRRALDFALVSLGRRTAAAQRNQVRASDLTHKAVAAASGALGGFLGPVTLAVELPLATLLMLRSIADIARSQGEDLSSLAGRLACVEVFALGGRSHGDDATDTGYYGLRAAIGLHFSGVVETAVGGTITIPLAVNMVRGIAARFGVVVSDKLALQMVPVMGAASGALVNLVFMQHFQDVAHGHFMVRRLERRHGRDAVRRAYERVAAERSAALAEYSRLEGW
ncbi:MAG: EcsC family protein [Burkholderiales bacterium]|nr:MAG: EcsC family protein [Burkholderiales bacterium]